MGRTGAQVQDRFDAMTATQDRMRPDLILPPANRSRNSGSASAWMCVLVAVSLVMSVLVTSRAEVAEAQAPTHKSNYEAAVDASEPAGWWKLDESSGTTYADSVASRDGTAWGSPTPGVSGPFGGASEAVDLGTTGCSGINLSSHDALFRRNGVSSPSLTLEAWVLDERASGVGYIFGRGSTVWGG